MMGSRCFEGSRFLDGELQGFGLMAGVYRVQNCSTENAVSGVRKVAQHPANYCALNRDPHQALQYRCFEH